MRLVARDVPLVERPRRERREAEHEDDEPDEDRDQPPANGALPSRFRLRLALALELLPPLEDRLAEDVVEDLVARALVLVTRRRRNRAQDAAAVA